jgi:hypothetical protein
MLPPAAPNAEKSLPKNSSDQKTPANGPLNSETSGGTSGRLLLVDQI